MELYIRSQDKTKLMKMGDLYVEFNGDVDPKRTPYRIVIDKFVCLGVYKDEKRALEVLDEIQKILMPTLFVRKGNEEHILLGAREAGITSKLEAEFKELPTYVYEMPEE